MLERATRPSSSIVASPPTLDCPPFVASLPSESGGTHTNTTTTSRHLVPGVPTPKAGRPPSKIIHSTGPECLASKRPLGSNLTIFAIRICPPSAKLAGQRSSWRSRTPAVPRCVFLSVQDFRTPDSSMISAPRPDLYKQAPEPLSSPSIRSVHGNHAFCTRRVENACSPGQDQAAIGTRG